MTMLNSSFVYCLFVTLF